VASSVAERIVGPEKIPGAPRPADAAISSRVVLQVQPAGRYGDKVILRDELHAQGRRLLRHHRAFGRGQSTLIRCVNRLVDPEGGEILFDGVDRRRCRQSGLRAVRRHIGMIFQEFNPIERMSVIGNVLAGRLGPRRHGAACCASTPGRTSASRWCCSTAWAWASTSTSAPTVFGRTAPAAGHRARSDPEPEAAAGG
jgi:hypothetical protein